MIRKLSLLILPLALASFTSGRAPAAQPTQTNTAPASPASAPSGDPLVAKGKGVEIRRSQLDKGRARAQSQLTAEGRSVKAEQAAALERQILEQLINIRLLAAQATEADKAAGKEAAEKRYAAAKAKVGSEEAFDRQVKLMGTTREELLAMWIEALTAEAVLKREFKIKITDEEARKAYDENPKEFDAPERVRMSHILFTTRDRTNATELPKDQKEAKHKTAEAVLKRARAGEDFALLAAEFSDDTVSKARGGEYTFSRGQMVPEVEAAAFALNTNQISGIVTSAYGYHIIKLSEKLPAGKVEFSKAIPTIKAGLTQQAIEKEFPDYIARLRKEAAVEILDEKLKPKDSKTLPGFPEPSPRPQPEKPPPAK